MMLKNNSIVLIVISIMMILFTEIIGINMQIAMNYLPIFFAIITMVFFNLKLKKEINDGKHLIIVNIIVIGLNFVLTKLIIGYLSYVSILAILILCRFTDKINFSQFNKFFIKNIAIYYIIPLVVLLGIDVGYPKLMSEISELSKSWMVNYTYFALVAIYDVLIANIVMVMLAILLKEIINVKIMININPKVIFIIFAVILIIILCIKIIQVSSSIKNADAKIDKLNNAIQANNLYDFYSLNLDSSLKLENMDKVQNKEKRYMMSFNEILTKGVSSWSELFYKTETHEIQDMVSRKTMNKKEALQRYTEGARNYVERLNIYKDNLSMQNVSNVIIYLVDIICIFIVYRKCVMSDESL